MTDPLLFFGCLRTAGHCLWTPGGAQLPAAASLTADQIDGAYAPRSDLYERFQDERAANLVHLPNGWTVLAMWDRSVETSYGSNAAFLAPGRLTVAQMWALARVHFPEVVTRLERRRRTFDQLEVA